MRWRKANAASVDEENPYWMSFSDMMSALLVIFILAAVILILQLMEKQEKFDQEISLLQQAERVRSDILKETVEELRQKNIKVEISENHTVLRIPNHLLGFDSAVYDISPDDMRNALEIGKTINKVITKDNRFNYLDTIFIEGHTDKKPYRNDQIKGNWGLSTLRAISLWQFWTSELPVSDRLDRLENQDGNPLFSVSGYADTRPVSDRQTSEADFSKNRRIDIRFTIRRPLSADYDGIRNMLGGASQ